MKAKRHPDAVFGQDTPNEDTAPAVALPPQGNDDTPLVSRIEALAVSLGLDASVINPDRTYDADAFVEAIALQQDKLNRVADILRRQNEDQRAKAIDLAKREQAIAFRERRMDAYDKLASLTASEDHGGRDADQRQRRGFWAWLFNGS